MVLAINSSSSSSSSSRFVRWSKRKRNSYLKVKPAADFEDSSNSKNNSNDPIYDEFEFRE